MLTTGTANTPMKTYRVEDIACILGIGKSSAYKLVRDGCFKSVRIGSSIRISKKSFDEWLDEQTNESKGAASWHPL